MSARFLSFVEQYILPQYEEWSRELPNNRYPLDLLEALQQEAREQCL